MIYKQKQEWVGTKFFIGLEINTIIGIYDAVQ
jgi:hypothetical protein